MKLNTNTIQYSTGFLVLVLFISFAITLPSVSAQEGTPSIPTATPTGTPTHNLQPSTYNLQPATPLNP
jgi:hypothetical protein